MVARRLANAGFESAPRQPRGKAAVTGGGGVDAWRAVLEREPGEQQSHGGRQARAEGHREIPPVRIAETELRQELFLPQAVELHDPVVPIRMEAVPDHACAKPESRSVHKSAGKLVRRSERLAGAAFDALRRDRGR